jgi:hypothetical protein
LSKTASNVTPLSPVLNNPPVESPTKKIAGLRGSIAISDTRPPIAAGPIDRALKFLKRMSVNFGGAVSDAGEELVDAPAVEAGVLVAVSSGVGEVVDGRVPTRVADGV